MKFLSGTRMRKGTYTVIPARPVMDMTTGQSQVTPAVRAKFEEHKFDSESAEMLAQYEAFCISFNVGKGKEQMLKPEDIKDRVEQYLLKHMDFGRTDGRGLFLDSSDTMTEIELRKRGVQRRCMFMQDIGEDTVQCGDIVDDSESDYCQTHQELVEAVAARSS